MKCEEIRGVSGGKIPFAPISQNGLTFYSLTNIMIVVLEYWMQYHKLKYVPVVPIGKSSSQ